MVSSVLSGLPVLPPSFALVDTIIEEGSFLADSFCRYMKSKGTSLLASDSWTTRAVWTPQVWPFKRAAAKFTTALQASFPSRLNNIRSRLSYWFASVMSSQSAIVASFNWRLAALHRMKPMETNRVNAPSGFVEGFRLSLIQFADRL